MSSRGRALSDPHLTLGAGAALVVAAEYAYQQDTSDAWLLLQAAIAATALLLAWRAQERLRAAPLLAIILALHAGLVALHLGLGLHGDPDSRAGGVFDREGRALLDGTYPHSEYPVGAALLFAAERGAGDTHAANAVAMVAFQLVASGAILALRRRPAPWLAALVGLWPMSMFYWENRFDLAPAALLALGIALAWRERWALSGAALAAGTLLKWSPGFAALVLWFWLAASGRARDALRHAFAFTLVVIVVYLPFLVWSPGAVWAAYSRQGGRSITAESLWYLPLRALGLAHIRGHISFSARAPGWADWLATGVQLGLVAAFLLAAWAARGNLRAGVSLAALAPAALLLTNRIFSPQFLLVILTAWALAAALLVRSTREQLAVGAVAAAVGFANAFVYPFALPWYGVTWQVCSAVLFAGALGLTAWLAARARRSPAGSSERGSRSAAPVG